MADYRFARRPAWIAGHLLALGLIVLMVALGFWQLRRLDDRRDQNALIRARTALAPVPVGEQVDPGDEGAVVDDLRFRAVEATGTYTDDTTVVRANQGGFSGGRVFSVLDLGGGEEVIVLRGFVGLAPGGTLDAPPPPPGTVDVQGVAVPRARLERVSRQALDDLEDAAGASAGILPVVIQVTEPEGDTLVPVPPPDLSEGPHLSYAVQWFLFSTVGAIGYPLLLRRRAREAPASAPVA